MLSISLKLKSLFLFIFGCLVGVFTVKAQQSVHANYSYQTFSDVYEPTHVSSISYHYKSSQFGTVIPKLNWTDRFNQQGLQYELEAYPLLPFKQYAYIGAAFSNSGLFPEKRFGLEWFVPIPDKMEHSIGYRYIDFRTNTTHLITASSSLYWHKWLFSIRPFMILSESDTGLSILLSTHYFFNDKGDKISILLNRGWSPDVLINQLGNADLSTTNILLNNSSISATGVKKLSTHWGAQLTLAFASQELLFQQGRYVQSYLFDFGLSYTF